MLFAYVEPQLFSNSGFVYIFLTDAGTKLATDSYKDEMKNTQNMIVAAVYMLQHFTDFLTLHWNLFTI